jgi:glucokinase
MNPELRAVGVDVGGTNIRAALVSGDGRILDFAGGRVPQGRDAIVAAIEDFIRRFDGPEVAAIGVGIPGRLDPWRGLVLTAGFIDFGGVPLGPILAERLGKPIAVDNDARFAMVAEQAVGAARGCANVAMFTIGTGIGGAVVSEGRLVDGRGAAGQFGHLTVDMNGAPCTCGRTGCIETTSSGTALGRAIKAAGLPPGTGFDELFAGRAAGDPVATAILDGFARPLRLAIDSMVAAFDPELVLLGGGLGAQAHRALQDAPALSSWYRCPVVPAALGDDAGVIGAALRALDLAV